MRCWDIAAAARPGVSGHNSFEVYLTGGAYGSGKWVLLDHDISTVIFAPDGSRLLSIAEIRPQLKTLGNPAFKPERQRGWYVSGLEDGDARGVYTAVQHGGISGGLCGAAAYGAFAVGGDASAVFEAGA